MNSDQVHPAQETSGGEMFRRPPWLTYAFAAVTLASVAGYDFLMYLRPEVADRLLWLSLACVVIAVIWLVVCAFLRKPRGAPVLLATLLIFYAPHLVASEDVPWLISLGFRLHASPIEQYLKKECRLTEFTEQGTTKVIGVCESREVGSVFNVAFELVIYDPTGALLKPERRDAAQFKMTKIPDYSNPLKSDARS